MEGIANTRDGLIKKKEETMRDKDQHRFVTDVDSDKVVVDVNA